MTYDVDLMVIGGGSGGVRAARVAANHGARVAIVEEYRWGGTCVIRGCVPKKLLVYASEVSRHVADAAGFGWSIAPPVFNWSALIAAKDREIARLSDVYQGVLRNAGVAIHQGSARIVDPHTVDIGGRAFSARVILVATGGRAKRPAIPGADLPSAVITSDEAFHLPQLPVRVAIIGGGYIGVEFAHILAGLGVAVTLAHRRDQVLAGFDREVRTMVDAGLVNHGVALRVGVEVVAIEAGTKSSWHLRLSDGSAIETDLVMSAIGRDPATEGLGVAELGVALDARRGIVVDEFGQSSVPSIYAVGDVTGRVALTPVAIREGQAFADTVFGDRPTPVDHSIIPTAVFAQPPVAAVGLTEDRARELGHETEIFRSEFRPMRHALSGRSERTLIKLVVDRTNRRVLGLHMVGADAPEIVQAAAIAITMKATKDDFDRTVAIHPTAAEELVLMRG